jgi:glucose-1-phosphate cytidylyltransferase
MDRVVILAGGLGTRMAEQTEFRPKPMVEIGGHPILWHIMNHFAHFGASEFFVALGYKGEFIKRYFLDYHRLGSDMTVNLGTGTVELQERKSTDWKVHLVDTGAQSMTGGRLRRLQPQLGKERFMLTYGDGVANVDIRALLAFHKSHGKLATITAVRPAARFGCLDFDGDRVSAFTEKSQIGEGWINGGFMVFEPGVFEYLKGDSTILESHALETLAAEKQLMAFRHEGFWQCMDTLREQRVLDEMWQRGDAPWKVWK